MLKVFQGSLFLLAAVVLLFLLLLVLTRPLPSAPLPHKEPPPPRTCLSQVDWTVGTWKMEWSGSTWDVTLSKNNDYQARHGNDVVWSGSWWLKDGKLWICESLTPLEPLTHVTYSIELDPVTLEGCIVSSSDGINRQPPAGLVTKMRFTRPLQPGSSRAPHR